MAETTINSGTYKLFPMSHNSHRELSVHEGRLVTCELEADARTFQSKCVP